MLILWNMLRIRRLFLLLIVVIAIIVISYRALLSNNDSLESKLLSFKKASLTYHNKVFYLKDEKFQILSGAIHYFRVPPDLWKSRLLFLKSAGLNTVETYCPWNLHEERKGIYNFDGILNLRKFVQLALELGLYVILRPGPYVCAELDFGGLPSWLLSDPNMKVRSTYIGFMVPVEEYMRQLMHEVNDLQHSNGGPIIAFQLENEYGTFGNSLSYMQAMKEIFIRSGVVESLFISDDLRGMSHQMKIDGVFYGINANKIEEIESMSKMIFSIDPELPLFVSEFWTGWYNSWSSSKSSLIISDDDFRNTLVKIIKQGFSLNLYMFHGGTNFGFINGANNASNRPLYVATSYDYNAPLSEDGRPNNKYFILRKTILNHLANEPNFKVVDIPDKEITVKYDNVDISYVLDFKSMLDLVDNSVISHSLKMMEELPINGNSGQSFGFILYRTEVKPFNVLKICGKIRDRAMLMYNDLPLTNYWKTNTILAGDYDVTLPLNNATKKKTNDSSNYLDILVENMGRYNYATFQTDVFNEQRKGIQGYVQVDNTSVNNWKIYPLEFKKSFINKVSGSTKWLRYQKISDEFPKMYKGSFIINDKPCSSHIMMSGWTKGVLFVNGVNLGRYWNVGPINSLFLPHSYLRIGENEIIIFELHTPGKSVSFHSNSVVIDSEAAVFN